MDSNEILLSMSQNTVTVAGISFILGSLFTVLMLVILEFMRSRSQKGDTSN